MSFYLNINAHFMIDIIVVSMQEIIDNIYRILSQGR